MPRFYYNTFFEFCAILLMIISDNFFMSMDFARSSKKSKLDFSSKSIKSSFNSGFYSNTNKTFKSFNEQSFSLQNDLNKKVNLSNKNNLVKTKPSLNDFNSFKQNSPNKFLSNQFSANNFKLKNIPIDKKIENLTKHKKEIKPEFLTKIEEEKNFIETNNDSGNKKTINFLDKVIITSIYFLFAGLPLFFLNLTYQGINFEKQYYFYFCFFVILIAWSGKSILKRQFIFKKTPLDLTLLLFFIICFLSSLFSVDKYHSFIGLFKFPTIGLISIFSMIIIFYLVIINATHSLVKNCLFFMVGVGSFISIWISSVFILIFFNFLSKDFIINHTFNILGTSLFSLSTFLIFLIPIIFITIDFLVELELKESLKRVINIFLYIALFSILLNILILSNHVYWVANLIALGVFTIFILGRVIKISEKMFFISSAVFLILTIIFVIKSPILKGDVLKNEYFLDYKISWQIAKNSLGENPFLGSGLGTYGYDFSLFRPVSKNLENWDSGRVYFGKGLIFESISTLGILGTLVLLALILIYIGYAFHLLNHSNNKNKKISLALFSSNLILIFSLLAGFLDSSLVLLSVLLTSLSIVALQKETEIELKQKVFSFKTSHQYALVQSFLLLISIIVIVYSLISLSKLFLADIYIKKAQNFYIKKNNEESSKYFEKGLTKNKNEGNYYSDLASYCFFILNDENYSTENKMSICESNLNGNVEQIDSTLKISSDTQFALLSAKLMPNDVNINQTAALIVYKSGWKYVADSLNEARKLYKKALELEPKNPFFDIYLADINITETQIIGEDNDKEKNKLMGEAKEYLNNAQSKIFDKNQVLSIYGKLSLINENLGNLDEAIKNLEEVIKKTEVILVKNKNNNDILNQQFGFKFNLARLLMVRGVKADNIDPNNDDLEKSESIFKQLLELDANNSSILLSLGLIYEKTSKKNEAVYMYKKALATFPNDDKNQQSRTEIQNKIDNLGSE